MGAARSARRAFDARGALGLGAARSATRSLGVCLTHRRPSCVGVAARRDKAHRQLRFGVLPRLTECFIVAHDNRDVVD